MKNIIKKTGYALAVLVTLVVLALVFLGLSSLKKPQENTQTKQITRLLSINPPQTEELKPDTVQQFKLSFASIDKTTPISVSLSYSSFKNPTKETIVKIYQKTVENDIIINTLEPILPSKTYTLILSQNSQILLKQNYISSNPIPTPVPQNNTTLQGFLPYTTQTYSLEYVSPRNIYIAHVKYDPKSSLSLNTQIEAVKTDVSQFIQSKGIIIDSVKIEYSLK